MSTRRREIALPKAAVTVEEIRDAHDAMRAASRIGAYKAAEDIRERYEFDTCPICVSGSMAERRFQVDGIHCCVTCMDQSHSGVRPVARPVYEPPERRYALPAPDIVVPFGHGERVPPGLRQTLYQRAYGLRTLLYLEIPFGHEWRVERFNVEGRGGGSRALLPDPLSGARFSNTDQHSLPPICFNADLGEDYDHAPAVHLEMTNVSDPQVDLEFRVYLHGLRYQTPKGRV